jgi:2-keto-4-pentenoate hydratase/2-oxohepta-3-ene-1,7-dioic acid hydratase in catechol pathway
VKHNYFDQEKIVPSKVVCIGRNYVKHIEELGNEIPENMVIFNKPNSAIAV